MEPNETPAAAFEITVQVWADPALMDEQTHPGTMVCRDDDSDPPRNRWDDLCDALRDWLGEYSAADVAAIGPPTVRNLDRATAKIMSNLATVAREVSS